MGKSEPVSRFMVLFATTRAYLLARSKVQHLPHEERNTPREMVELCGMCLVFEERERAAVEALLPASDPAIIYLPFPENR